MIRCLTSAIRRFGRGEEGTATVEFVLCLPVVLFVFLASFESGLAMVRKVLLERSTDVVIRQLRLGLIATPTSPRTMRDELKDRICGEEMMMINCRQQIAIEIIGINRNTWTTPSTDAPCYDRTKNSEPSSDLSIGVQNAIMLVRVCVVQDALFPFTGIGLRMKVDSTGYEVITVSSFVNEPTT